MEKAITAAVATVLAVSAAHMGHDDGASNDASVSANVERAPAGQVLAESGGPRNLVLRALGTREPGADQLRIPVPADHATYEVTIERPGTPKSVPVAEGASSP